MEPNKTKKIRTSKFLNDEERKDATRLRNTINKRNSRAANKVNQAAIINDSKFLFDKDFRRIQYRKNLFNWLKNESFNQFLTLTSKYAVGKNKIKTIVKKFITKLQNSGFVGNIFIAYEFNSNEYHSHLLIQNNCPEMISKLIEEWKHGDKKSVDLADYPNKNARIDYITKCLSPCSTDDKIQGLNDSWEFIPKPENFVESLIGDVRRNQDIIIQNVEYQQNTVNSEIDLVIINELETKVIASNDETVQHNNSRNILNTRVPLIKKIKRCIYDKVRILKNHFCEIFFKHKYKQTTLEQYMKKTLVIEKHKADAFVKGMDALAEKFNNKYIKGELCDVVKLDSVHGNLALTYLHEVPELVKIACTMCFVETLL